jgi:hypothetical protein
VVGTDPLDHTAWRYRGFLVVAGSVEVSRVQPTGQPQDGTDDGPISYRQGSGEQYRYSQPLRLNTIYRTAARTTMISTEAMKPASVPNPG